MPRHPRTSRTPEVGTHVDAVWLVSGLQRPDPEREPFPQRSRFFGVQLFEISYMARGHRHEVAARVRVRIEQCRHPPGTVAPDDVGLEIGQP